MSDPIKTEYRGHAIFYGENSDEWHCNDVGRSGASSSSLAKVKQAIDKMYLDLRKKAATPCFEIGIYNRGQRTESVCIEYIEPVWEGGGWNTAVPRHVANHKVAVVAKRDGSTKPSRRETKLSELMPDTPEAEAAWQEFKRLCAIAEAANKAANAAFDAIPRLTVDDIAALVEIKNNEAK